MMRMMLFVALVLLPVCAGAQVEFEKVRGPAADISPQDQRRLEMLEQIKARKAPPELVERRRERLKKAAQLRSDPYLKEEFAKYHRRLARILRIHQIARASGNVALAERGRALLKAEIKRHSRVIQAATIEPQKESEPTAKTDLLSEGSEP